MTAATAFQPTGTISALSFHGLPALELVSPQGAKAIITLHGAQVQSWVPAGGTEQLFVSERSDFSGKQPIRGGVPVCFPQFSGQGPLPKHGLVRTATWDLLAQEITSDCASVTLGTCDSAASRAQWPHAFKLQLAVTLTATSLDIVLNVTNPGTEAFSFTAALHTYLRVASIDAAHVDGLAGIEYRDAAQGNRVATQDVARLTFSAETDRVYHAAPALRVGNSATTALSIQAQGFVDTVVWNPGPALCAKLADMHSSGYREMLCVEAACADTQVTIAPGQSWTGSQTLQAIQR